MLSATSQSAALDLESARTLPTRTQIVVVDRSTRSPVQRVTVLRYAGHYEPGAVDAFAVKDASGKFLVLSADELGLTATSSFEARLVEPVTIDSDDGHAA